MIGMAIEVMGWLGALTVAAAYLLFSMHRIGNGYLFQTANLAGAACMVAHGAYHAAWPSATVNIIWCTIAVISLIRLKLHIPVTVSAAVEEEAASGLFPSQGPDLYIVEAAPVEQDAGSGRPI